MIDVQIDAGGRAGVEAVLRAAVEATLAAEGVSEGEVSLALLGDDAIRTMNRDHLGHDWVTDVISFALWDEGEPVVGDLYLGVDQAARQAAEHGVDPVQELARLAVHGTLHVLGWDHPEDAADRAGSEMYRRQEEILASLGIPSASGGDA